MRALSIRQPYAEVILRRGRTAEYRSRLTRLLGQAFDIHAARTPGDCDTFALPDCAAGDLPTGVIVGDESRGDASGG